MSMSMADRDGLIWFDGEWVDWRDAQVHVLTHTLHYGAGVFEGVRVYLTDKGPAIFRLQDHTRRFFNSAKIIGMSLPWDMQTLMDAQCQAVQHNNLNSGYIRPMAFYGSEGVGLRADGLKVHCIIAAWDWGTYLGDAALKQGIRVKTSSYARHHPNVSMCRGKINGHYVNSILALREALDNGCEEALMLDVDGYVSEGTGENVFIVRDGVIYTPEVASALDGITRNTLITLAADVGIELVTKRITRDEVYIADEAFFSGTAAEVTPIRELDGRAIGTGKRGPVTEKLQALYFDSVAGRGDHPQWNHLVQSTAVGSAPDAVSV